MDFEACYKTSSAILMEGAIGERLKREYHVALDEQVALAGLIYREDSRRAMQNIFEEYLAIAERYRLTFMATTTTRRANRERVGRSGFDEKIIEDNVRFLQQIKSHAKVDMFVGGLMGCKGDAYQGTDVLAIDEARMFHGWQADQFRAAGADFLFAGIMPALSEATGMAKAMEDTGLPYIISFMIRDNGRLIDGTSIHDAILYIDDATDRNPICYMANCVHPIVLQKALAFSFNQTDLVKNRFGGVQANTSSLPPEQLDNCVDLKSSDGVSLAHEMMELTKYFLPKIFGGCCGTDCTHIEAIAKMISGRQVLNY